MSTRSTAAVSENVRWRHGQLAPQRQLVMVRIAVGAVVLWAVFVGLGRLVVDYWTPSRFGRTEEDLLDRLTAARTPIGETAPLVLTTLAAPVTVAALTTLIAAGLYLALRRWVEPLFLVACVLGEMLIFTATLAVVDRPRPPVVGPDVSPVTVGFLTGQTGAAVCLYGGIAVLGGVLVKKRTHRRLLWAFAIVVPLTVAVCQLYRGVYFPSGVVINAMLGVLWLVWMTRSYPMARRRGSRGDGAGMTAVVVVNPAKIDKSEYDTLADALAHEGVDEVTFAETTAEDAGAGQSRQAVADGADVVIAWGGDGTVMACVTGMAGSDTPLAILAGGTGNLLVRNLEIPLDFADGVHVAVHGARRRIDVGVVGEEKFAVMAGMGFDAALLRDASEQAKARVGSAAYLLSGLRNLTQHRFTCTVTVDDGEPVRAQARTVLVGNVGKLQGGLPVLRDAVPDDGMLDVLVISPRTKLEWLGVAIRVIVRRTHPEHMECMRGRRVLIESQTVEPYELDGDLRGETRSMLCEIEAGALVLCVPSVDKPKPGL